MVLNIDSGPKFIQKQQVLKNSPNGKVKPCFKVNVRRFVVIRMVVY